MKKILLADDHSPTRMMFTHILDGQHYQIIHASNGEEAYSLAVFEKPQLILMDVMMPVMDGYEALAKIKEDPVTQTIPVMMLTATDRPVERRLATELGAIAYMVKPVRVDEFHRNINSAMACAARHLPTLKIKNENKITSSPIPIMGEDVELESTPSSPA